MEYKSNIKAKERILLIRKGNELFNKAEYDKAEKIFIHTHYVDGLIRLGDFYYFKKHDILHAHKLYLLSGYKKRINEVTEFIAHVISQWLKEK